MHARDSAAASRHGRHAAAAGGYQSTRHGRCCRAFGASLPSRTCFLCCCATGPPSPRQARARCRPRGGCSSGAAGVTLPSRIRRAHAGFKQRSPRRACSASAATSAALPLRSPCRASKASVPSHGRAPARCRACSAYSSSCDAYSWCGCCPSCATSRVKTRFLLSPSSSDEMAAIRVSGCADSLRHYCKGHSTPLLICTHHIGYCRSMIEASRAW